MSLTTPPRWRLSSQALQAFLLSLIPVDLTWGPQTRPQPISHNPSSGEKPRIQRGEPEWSIHAPGCVLMPWGEVLEAMLAYWRGPGVTGWAGCCHVVMIPYTPPLPQPGGGGGSGRRGLLPPPGAFSKNCAAPCYKNRELMIMPRRLADPGAKYTFFTMQLMVKAVPIHRPYISVLNLGIIIATNQKINHFLSLLKWPNRNVLCQWFHVYRYSIQPWEAFRRRTVRFGIRRH